MATPLLDKLNELLGRKKKPDTPEPTPTPAPVSPPSPPNIVDYVKAWRRLKEIPFHKLGRAIGLSGVIVFFAISGVLAWVSLLAKFMLGVVR